MTQFTTEMAQLVEQHRISYTATLEIIKETALKSIKHNMDQAIQQFDEEITNPILYEQLKEPRCNLFIMHSKIDSQRAPHSYPNPSSLLPR